MLKIFSERLRAARGTISQREIEEKTNIKAQSISNYEHEKREPDLEKLCALANCLGVSADWLLGLTDDRHGVQITGSPGAVGVSSSPYATVHAHDASGHDEAIAVTIAQLRKELEEQKQIAANLSETLRDLAAHFAPK